MRPASATEITLAVSMPCAIRRLNAVVLAKSSSMCIALLSPDVAANSKPRAVHFWRHHSRHLFVHRHSAAVAQGGQARAGARPHVSVDQPFRGEPRWSSN
jgi:hypothetical protein